MVIILPRKIPKKRRPATLWYDKRVVERSKAVWARLIIIRIVPPFPIHHEFILICCRRENLHLFPHPFASFLWDEQKRPNWWNHTQCYIICSRCRQRRCHSSFSILFCCVCFSYSSTFYFAFKFFLLWLPVAFETMNPATKPSAIASSISIIWDMPTFQKNNRNVTTSVFWINMIRNRASNTATTIYFSLIVTPPPQPFHLPLLEPVSPQLFQFFL